MLLLLSNNVQVLKIVAFVQDSNLIICKVYSTWILDVICILTVAFLSEIGLHPNFMSLPCLHLFMYTSWCIKKIYLVQKFNFAADNSFMEQLLPSFNFDLSVQII